MPLHFSIWKAATTQGVTDKGPSACTRSAEEPRHRRLRPTRCAATATGWRRGRSQAGCGTCAPGAPSERWAVWRRAAGRWRLRRRRRRHRTPHARMRTVLVGVSLSVPAASIRRTTSMPYCQAPSPPRPPSSTCIRTHNLASSSKMTPPSTGGYHIITPR